MTQEIIDKHKENRNIIAVLQSIQEKYGYIPEQDTAKIAKVLDIPLVRIWGVATFYSQFKLQKPGKYTIQVCNGTACHVNDSSNLISKLHEVLGIDDKQTTKDGLFSLELVNCIGACARAPAIMIDGKVYGNLKPDDLKAIIDEFKQ